MAETPSPLPWAPDEALGVFMGLLSEIETATPASSEFYDRLCEATCRLAHLQRAVIFLWDDARREVRPVGSSGVPLEVFAGRRVSAGNVPMARAALAGDCVVEVTEHFEDHIPADLYAVLQPRNLVCSPLSAGGLWLGAMLGERQDERLLTDAERHTLWTLGKVAALAASARIATRQQERAQRLTERIDLARDLHDSVIQRLFAVGMVLGADKELTEEDRRRCNDEVQVASQELRAAMQRPLARTSRETNAKLSDVLERLRRESDLGLRPQWEPGVELPERFEALAQNVLAEAVRNARKHAAPTGIDVAVAREGDALILQVANDGVAGMVGRKSGMGLRLAALEAMHHGALVEFGPEEPGRWRVRLMMPVEEP